MTPSLGIEPAPHWWEASALTTAPSLHEGCNGLVHFVGGTFGWERCEVKHYMQVLNCNCGVGDVVNYVNHSFLEGMGELLSLHLSSS